MWPDSIATETTSWNGARSYPQTTEVVCDQNNVATGMTCWSSEASVKPQKRTPSTWSHAETNIQKTNLRLWIHRTPAMLCIWPRRMHSKSWPEEFVWVILNDTNSYDLLRTSMNYYEFDRAGMESNAASQSSEASVDLQNRVPITGSHTETNIYKNKIYDYEHIERLRCLAFGHD